MLTANFLSFWLSNHEQVELESVYSTLSSEGRRLKYRRWFASGFNILGPRQNGRYSADDILEYISMYENYCNAIYIWSKCIRKNAIDNKPALV